MYLLNTYKYKVIVISIKMPFNFNILKDIWTQIYNSTTKNKKELGNDLLRKYKFSQEVEERSIL